MGHCRDAIAPFAPKIGAAGLRAMLGAGEALSTAANGELSQDEPHSELHSTIIAVTERHAG